MSGRIVFAGNQRTNPRWLADFGGRERMAVFPAKIDKAAFSNFYGVDVVLTANAAAAAVSIVVTALTPPQPSTVPIQSIGAVAIPAGSVLNFGQAASKFAYVTADAKYGDTTIAVAPLPTALVATDDAKWDLFGNIFVPSGILVGRTFASRDSGTALFEPGDSTSHDEMYLTMFDIPNLMLNNDVELVRINAGVTIKENYLPGFATLLSGNLTYIRAHYNTIKGYN